MSKDFVIDENVVRNAWHGKKDDGTDAFAEEKFLQDILYGKQHISASKKILEKFINFRKKTRGVKEGVNHLLFPAYLKLLLNSQRTTMHTPIKTDFKGVKKCDVEFVGVTIKSKGVLVTADRKLKKAVEKDPKISSNCDCKTVEEAIKN